MTAAGWLIDKSALISLTTTPDFGQWRQRVDRGLVRICVPTLLEVWHSSRKADDWRANVD